MLTIFAITFSALTMHWANRMPKCLSKEEIEKQKGIRCQFDIISRQIVSASFTEGTSAIITERLPAVSWKLQRLG